MKDTDSSGRLDSHDDRSTDTQAQAFERDGLFIIGAGDSLDELEASGEWLAAKHPVDREAVE